TLQNVILNTSGTSLSTSTADDGALVTSPTGGLSLAAPSASGQCLMSNSVTAPSFQSCPGGGGSGYANGGNNYTNNATSACGTTAKTRIATSYDTNITNPVVGICT